MEMITERRRTVASHGAELAVFEYGPEPDRTCRRCCWCTAIPTTIGCTCRPSGTWPERHHVVAYDTRNAGASAVIGLPGDFTLKTLVDDMFAVLAAVGATDVHLVGHDWGSIQGWAAVQDPRAADLIGRYTCISGPDLRHFARWVRSRYSRPRAWPQLAGQLARSWYIAAFLVPQLPEAAWRLFLTKRYERTAKRDVGDDPIRGLALYRANFFRARNWPAGGRVTMPVLVVVPRKDPSCRRTSWTDSIRGWTTCTVIRVDSGHWWPASRPAEFAELLRGSYVSR